MSNIYNKYKNINKVYAYIIRVCIYVTCMNHIYMVKRQRIDAVKANDMNATSILKNMYDNRDS